MSKFVEGQTVQIKTNLVVEQEYGDAVFVAPMVEYLGKYATITEVDEDGYDYKLNIDGGVWWWNDDMLDCVYCANCVDYVNPPSLEALEKYIVETTRAIFEADEERDQLEVFELEFIENLLTACCKHKIIRLTRKEDDENGDC